MNDLLAGSGEAAPEGELDAELLAMEEELMPSVPTAAAEANAEAGAAAATPAEAGKQAAPALPAVGLPSADMAPASGTTEVDAPPAASQAAAPVAAAVASADAQPQSIRDEVRTAACSPRTCGAALHAAGGMLGC